MIISHRHKFIFLKTNKTAGTSVEIALSRFCGPDDIITPISPEDEEIRSKLGYPGAQNYLSSINNKPLFYNHIPAKEVKDLIGKEKWTSYYKFCFERNPWDRAVSLYYWDLYYSAAQSDLQPTISQFIRSDALLHLKTNGCEVYMIDGEIAVDKVCRFENITEELEIFRKQIGIPEILDLPNAKSHYRKDKRSYRDILNDEDKALIGQLFRDEINIFKYEW